MRCGYVIGLAILLFVAVSQTHAEEEKAPQTNRQLVDLDVQGHENTSGRKARQFGFRPPPPPPPPFGRPGFGRPGFAGPGFGGPGFGGPGFGGPGFGRPGFGGPGFGGPGFGGPGVGGGAFGGGVRVRETVVTREKVVGGGGIYG